LAQVSGTVRAAGETDLSETVVLMFPVSYRAWVMNGMNTRLSRTARASRAGAFSASNVPAGDYFIVAVDRSAAGDLQDPAYLDALSRVATRIVVADQPVTQDLNKMQVKR